MEKNEFMLKMYFLPLSSDKTTAFYLCDMLSNLFLVSDIFTVDFGRHYAMLKTVELHVPTKQLV